MVIFPEQHQVEFAFPDHEEVASSSQAVMATDTLGGPAPSAEAPQQVENSSGNKPAQPDTCPVTGSSPFGTPDATLEELSNLAT